MMDENKEILHLVHKYENMLQEGTNVWFDSIDYVDIIDWYQDHDLFDKATEVINRAYELFPDDEEVVIRLVDTFIAKKDYNSAIEALKPCLENNPSNMIHSALAGIYIEKGSNLKEAEEILTRLIEEEKDDYYFNYYLLGRLFLMTARPDKAEPYLRRALLEDPEDNGILLNYAQCGEYKDLNEIVKKTLTHLTDKHPFNDMLWYFLGVTQYENGEYNEALVSLDYAIAIDSEDSIRHALKADIFFALGQEDLSIEESLIACKYTNEPHDFYINIANMYLHQKNYTDAETYFKMSLEAEGKKPSPIGLLGLAQTYFLSGKKTLANRLMDKAWGQGFESRYFLATAEKLHDEGLIEESASIFAELTNDEDYGIALASIVALAYISAECDNVLEAMKLLEEAIRSNFCTDDLYFAILEISCLDSKFYHYTKMALSHISSIENFEDDIKRNFPELLENKNYIKALKELNIE